MQGTQLQQGKQGAQLQQGKQPTQLQQYKVHNCSNTTYTIAALEGAQLQQYKVHNCSKVSNLHGHHHKLKDETARGHKTQNTPAFTHSTPT
jgi:hypothetical protein